MSDRPTPGELEERAQPLTVDGRRLRGVIPFGVESRDLGGFREIIEPTALRDTDLSNLVATVEHRGVPIGRHPGTLQIEVTEAGAHWSVDPPRSRQDVVEAVERGDLRSGSWRMIVGRDRWQGDVRHVEHIAELRDVSIVSDPAYDTAAVELRSNQQANRPEDQTMDETVPAAAEADNTVTHTETPESAPEDRSAAPVQPQTPQRPEGTLRVEGVQSRSRRSLADEFRAAGFPGERATISWEDFESRAITWSASVDLVNQVDRQGGPLGFDQRYAWPALARVGVDAAATSVLVAQQVARSLATAASIVRAIDATTTKPETGSTVNLETVTLHQVATVQSGIPNVFLLQPAINTVIETDLRLAINEGLDKLFLDSTAASGFQAPGTDPLIISIRKAMTTLFAAGYSPDTLILTPSASEGLDVAVSGISGGTQDYIFGPGNFATQIFQPNRRISKTAAAPIVLDSSACGKLYASPVTLARFEENAGASNSSLIRMELNAACGVERQAAAVRIAAA